MHTIESARRDDVYTSRRRVGSIGPQQPLYPKRLAWWLIERQAPFRKEIRTGAIWVGGDGPPVLLLHGYPQTHATSLHVAPVLARQFTVVVPDLRGYDASDAPADDDDSHTVYSKREIAADQADIMVQLGFPEYAVVGHDRGALNGRVGPC